jgi:hypothetical protein
VRCKHCHSSLANLGGERRCPECGDSFNPDDPNTFDPPEPVRFRTIQNALLSILLGWVAVCLWIFIDLVRHPSMFNNGAMSTLLAFFKARFEWPWVLLASVVIFSFMWLVTFARRR